MDTELTSTEEWKTVITKCLQTLRSRFGDSSPDMAMILGSGLGSFADELEDSLHLPYGDLPGFPLPTVPGHSGECVVGKMGDKRVLIFRGRFHFYEGHSLHTATLPVRVAGAWKIPTLIVTNAAGGIRKDWAPASLMVISDHLNLLGHNPLRGANLDDFGTRFPDLSNAYDPAYRKQMFEIAQKANIDLKEGIYAAMNGPSYETPAEVRMLRTLGADAVGMSTVPETIVARHHGMRVLGMSCITNHAAGVQDDPGQEVNHEEVIENSKKAEAHFKKLLKAWVKAV